MAEFYQWDFESVRRNAGVLFSALWLTLGLTGATVALGSPLALGVMLARISRYRPLSWAARLYIEVFRDLPVLVVLIWLFYALPALAGNALNFSPFIVALLGLALNFSALEAEILRAAFEAIPRGQVEAASALGFNSVSTLRRIIIPQVCWRSVAPSLGQSINTLKLTSLASFVAVPELFYTTGALIQETFRPLEFYTTLAVGYLIIIIPLSALLQVLERGLAQRFEHD